MGMDGTNPTVIADEGLGRAWGIAIDFKTSKLFWTDIWSSRIESSNFQGGKRRTILNNSIENPTGIAVADGRIYWGENDGQKLKSCTITGENVTTLYNGTVSIYGIALVPDVNLPQNRTNHCARHNCAKVCVLTASSYRCLP